jgi:hypothetical protein
MCRGAGGRAGVRTRGVHVCVCVCVCARARARVHSWAHARTCALKKVHVSPSVHDHLCYAVLTSLSWVQAGYYHRTRIFGDCIHRSRGACENASATIHPKHHRMIIDSSVVDAVASSAEVPHQPADSALVLAPLRASVISAHSPSWLHTHRGHPDDDSADAPDGADPQRQEAATGLLRPNDDSAGACDEEPSQRREATTPILQLTPAAAGDVAALACTAPRVCDAADYDRSLLHMDQGEGHEYGDQVQVENPAEAEVALVNDVASAHVARPDAASCAGLPAEEEPLGADAAGVAMSSDAEVAACGVDVARRDVLPCCGLPAEEEPSGADVAGVDMPSDAELTQRRRLWRDASIVVGMHPDQVGKLCFVVPTFDIHTFMCYGIL